MESPLKDPQKTDKRLPCIKFLASESQGCSNERLIIYNGTLMAYDMQKQAHLWGEVNNLTIMRGPGKVDLYI